MGSVFPLSLIKLELVRLNQEIELDSPLWESKAGGHCEFALVDLARETG